MSGSEESVIGFLPSGGEKSDSSEYNVYETPQPQSGSKRQWWRKNLHMLRPDWILDHMDYRSFKLVLPTFVQVWVTVILCVIPATSHWIGAAAYLLQIIGFICANGGMLVSLNVTVSIACFVMTLIGWLFAIVALAISTKIRGWPLVEDIAQQLVAEGKCTPENVDLCMFLEFYSGRYLQTRCTAIFAIATVLGVAMLGLTQQFHPLARLSYVCGVISLIINCNYTVFYPVFLPKTTGLTILKPMAFALAMKILSSILVYPFTSNSRYFDGIVAVIDALTKVSKKNQTFFSTMKPSLDSFTNYENLLGDIEKIRLKLTPLDLFLENCRLEASYGRFNSGDAAEFRARIKPLLTTFAGYQYFYLLLQERKLIAARIFVELPRKGSLSSAHYPTRTLYSSMGHPYGKVGLFESKQRRKILEEQVNLKPEDAATLRDLDTIADIIKDRNSLFPEALTKILEAIRQWLKAANDYRTWSLLNRQKHAKEQAEQHQRLLEARAEFQREFDLLKESEASFDFSGVFLSNEKILSLISQVSLFQYLSKEVAHLIFSLLDVMLALDENRPRPKLFSILGNFSHEKKSNISRKLWDEDPTELSTGGMKTFTKQRDPDSFDPTTHLQFFMSYFFKFYRLLRNDHMWFWIRCGLLTMACCFPYYCRTTAHWYIEKRLIWLCIVCAVSTAEFTAETIYQYACKLIYSFFGVLTGLIAWYISTGSGTGNYYGYCVVTAVVYFVLSYYRHFAVHLTQIPSIMTTVTPTLVLGTSWVDGKYNKLGNIGYGWPVAVVRFVSVVVGLSVALLASTFPKPKSSKVAVRKSLANALEQTCNLQCRISDFAMRRFDDPKVHLLSQNDPIADELRTLILALAHVKRMMVPVQYEVPLSGAWPTEKYQRLHLLTTDIVQLYFFLYRLVDQVIDTDEWIPHMINRAGWNHPELVADMVSLVYMSSESLRLKFGIPEITNATLSLKHLEVLRVQWGSNRISSAERFYHKGDGELRHREPAINYEKLAGHDEQLNIVNLILMHMIYKRVDEAVLVVKGLVGEKYDYNVRLFDM